jgi:hypothetical protein
MRTSRQMPEITRQKISASLRNRGLSSTHKERISAGMKKYWATIPATSASTDEFPDSEYNGED